MSTPLIFDPTDSRDDAVQATDRLPVVNAAGRGNTPTAAQLATYVNGAANLALVNHDITTGNNVQMSVDVVTDFGNSFAFSRALTAADDAKMLNICVRWATSSTDDRGSWTTQTIPAALFRTAANTASGTALNSIPAGALHISSWYQYSEAAFRRAGIVKVSATRLGGAPTNNTGYVLGLRVNLLG